MVIRDAFLASAGEARALIASRDCVRRWDEPSALDRMTIGEVAAHLGRATITVRDYLRLDEPDSLGGAGHTADWYFTEAARLTNDLDSELNVSIRARATAGAAAGAAATLAELDAALAEVETMLGSMSATRLVSVFGGTVMVLDEYLVTRMVELAVHLDDLASSLGRATPELPEVARACVIGCLLAMARRTHGDVEVIRAFTRRERASADVLHVL